ncbi:MAG: ribonuclease J [Anaerovoracaceae bacterium]
MIPLGGMQEIGKNLNVLEYENEIIIIDCGLSFPDDEMYGIDIVIPDFTYLIKNAEKIKGVIITHGHEDHIGAVPYLIKHLNVPIYGTALPLGLIKNKFEEHGLKGQLNKIAAGSTIKLGHFKIEAIRTTHSIADSVCLCIDTPVGKIFHTGDFKIDYTPVDGEPIDLAKLAEIGQKGLLLMMADSTNATRPGFTKSEKLVGEALENIFRNSTSRIIIATFSSNVHRIQKIIDNAVMFKRKVAVSGRSMINVVTLAMELGYLSVPEGTLLDVNKTKKIPDKELVIITTGSQGEPMSALSRMANANHKAIQIKYGDQVILSSTAIPGNEKLVSNVVNKLFELGAEVIYSDIADTHVSGHACQEELKLMQSLLKPKYFMPVHGEFRHLKAHADLAKDMGVDGNNIFMLENGDALQLTANSAKHVQGVTSAEGVMVDGLGVGDVGNIVLRDRRLLSESGLIIVVAAIDQVSRNVVSGPDLISRGFVYVRENEDLIEQATVVAQKALERCENEGSKDWNTMKSAVRDDLRKFIYNKTERNPVILPIFMEV